MGMKLSEADLSKLLPQWMREDDADIGLAEGVSTLFADPGSRVSTLRSWDQIDSLTEAELDEIAWELNIDWYDVDASISTKRAVIKTAGAVLEKRGTKYAVEQMAIAAFGDAEVKEWFDYAGSPYHFRIDVDDSTATGVNMDYVRKMLDRVKPVRAVCDAITYWLQATFEIEEEFFVDFMEILFNSYCRTIKKLDGSSILDGSDLLSSQEYWGPEVSVEASVDSAIEDVDSTQEYTLVTIINWSLLDGAATLDGTDTMNASRTEEEVL